MSGLAKIMLAALEHTPAPGSRQSEILPRFLAHHKTMEEALYAVLRSRLCRAVVADLCRATISKYGQVDPWEAMQTLSKYRSFSEGTSINVISEVCDWRDTTAVQARLRTLFANLLPEQKASLLTRVFYNLMLIGFQRKISRIRTAASADAVPNVSSLLLSVCNRCNLDCIDCESADERGGADATPEQVEYVIRQARRLNIFHVVIMGKGEPLLNKTQRRLVFRVAARHPDLNFIVITNGTTVLKEDVVQMKRLPNLLLLVSIDGLQEVNDRRRGAGVFERVSNTFELLKAHNLIYGFSTTVFRQNYRHVLSGPFLEAMNAFGCTFGIYLACIPLSRTATSDMMLNKDEMKEYEELYARTAREAPVLLIDPELFERAHGCRAKRGAVVYIDAATGKVAPCVKTPFAPELCNLYRVSGDDRLREILRSEFFVGYRSRYEPCGQCSLNLPQELGRFAGDPAVAARDRERADRFRMKVLSSTLSMKTTADGSSPRPERNRLPDRVIDTARDETTR